MIFNLQQAGVTESDFIRSPSEFINDLRIVLKNHKDREHCVYAWTKFKNSILSILENYGIDYKVEYHSRVMFIMIDDSALSFLKLSSSDDEYDYDKIFLYYYRNHLYV